MRPCEKRSLIQAQVVYCHVGQHDTEKILVIKYLSTKEKHVGKNDNLR